MISIANLAKSFGGRTLFSGASMQFNRGERYGIVGANGSGKSTFLRILAGQDSASDGDVSIPKRAVVGVLEQDHFQYEDERILDVVMMGNEIVWAAMEEKEKILARASDHFDAERYAAVEDLILQGDGYGLEARAGEILEGLGIATRHHDQPLSTLSGGFKLRVLLAQVLASSPDVLLLDEPTNHLDILSIRWLEEFLQGYKGVALLISHDHRFLDTVATTIVDVDYGGIKAYPGNYAAFVRAKREERERKEAEIEKREAVIAEHKAFVERFRSKATKARQAQSKLKMIDRIEIERLPESSRRYPRFRFQQKRPSGRQVVEIKDLAKSYGEKRVLDGIDLVIQRGDRIAIIGPNGIGKSTLLEIMMGASQPDRGTVLWGYETHPGYVAQDHKSQLVSEPGAERQTLEDWLGGFCPGEPIGFVKGQLAAVLFSGEEGKKRLGALSGGEAARLLFARQAVAKPNVLVLDEPTNHLDLEAIEALVAAVREFDGTLVFVSHDRWFVNELATRIVEITPEGVRDFQGTYDEYLARSGEDHLDAAEVLRRARESKRAARDGVVREGSTRPGAPRTGAR